jgi:hypothetical protein
VATYEPRHTSANPALPRLLTADLFTSLPKPDTYSAPRKENADNRIQLLALLKNVFFTWAYNSYLSVQGRFVRECGAIGFCQVHIIPFC